MNPTTNIPPPPRPRVLVSWSSGKDAAWTLHTLRMAGEVEVVGLLTSLNAEFDRVAMHSVRRTLVESQAEAAGLPLIIVPLPWPCSNVQYETAMNCALEEAREKLAITHVAFGDLFLEDIRRYREEKMAQHTGLTPLFPLWETPTDTLARQMIAGGLRARLTCVDPCGEAGEFHTFAYDGPMFARPISVTLGEIVERDGFCFADLLPQPL